LLEAYKTHKYTAEILDVEACGAWSNYYALKTKQLRFLIITLS
jgi:hypothetical protein